MFSAAVASIETGYCINDVGNTWRSRGLLGRCVRHGEHIPQHGDDQEVLTLQGNETK